MSIYLLYFYIYYLFARLLQTSRICFSLLFYFIVSLYMLLNMESLALTHKEIRETVKVTEGEDPFIGMFV